MNKEQQIDAIEAQVREQHPSWNNADIRSEAVRMFYMNTTTVMQIIKMIEQEEKHLWEKMFDQEVKRFHECNDSDAELMHDEYYYGAANTLINLKKHLQSYIEAELNKAEQ